MDFDYTEFLLSFTPISLVPTLTGVVIYPDQNKQVAQLMWTHHLIVTTVYPVYTWKESDRGNLKYFEPIKELSDHSGGYCNLSYCEYCGVGTPFISKSHRKNDECFVCLFKKNEVKLTEINIQTQFDQILSYGHNASNSDKKSLSIFLMALGRWNTITERQKQELENHFRVPSGSIGYNVAYLLVLIDLLKMDDRKDTNLDLDISATKYRDKWCPDLENRIDYESWRKIVAHGFNGWLRQKVIEKVDKGVYKKTPNFQEIIQQIIEL